MTKTGNTIKCTVKGNRGNAADLSFYTVFARRKMGVEVASLVAMVSYIV